MKSAKLLGVSMLRNMVYAALVCSSAWQVQAASFAKQDLQIASRQISFDQSASNQSAEFNIAKGLAPTLKSQQMSVLEPFAGEFRILGSKEYHQDEQAKFSPIEIWFACKVIWCKLMIKTWFGNLHLIGMALVMGLAA